MSLGRSRPAAANREELACSLAALAEAIDVDDRDQVVERGVSGPREAFPHGALGELAVPRENPDTTRKTVETQCEREAHTDRQAEAKRPRCDVHPGEPRRRMAFEATAEATVGRKLLLVDGTRGAYIA